MTDDSSFKRFVFAQSKATQNCTITAKISFEKNKQCFARFQQKFNMLSTLNIPALLRILNILLFLSKACSISISGDFLYHMCLAVSVCDVCLCLAVYVCVLSQDSCVLRAPPVYCWVVASVGKQICIRPHCHYLATLSQPFKSICATLV